MLGLIFLLFFLNPNPTSTVLMGPCRIIAIADGDTFTILQDKKQIRIRIDAIDAPESGMPFSKNSKKYLSALCFNRYVTLNVKTTDRYGRLVARVTLPDGRDLSAEMIRAGMAWHYKKYSKDKVLAALEVQARASGKGLWHDKNPIAPWEFRKLRRKGISTIPFFL